MDGFSWEVRFYCVILHVEDPRIMSTSFTKIAIVPVISEVNAIWPYWLN